MSIKISQDSAQESKINSESPGINEKFIGSADNKDGDTTKRVDVHNLVHNEFLNLVKTDRTMALPYFKSAMSAVYSDIFGKSLVWKNIQDDPDVQINIKKILKDHSYVKVYDILKYYSDDAGKDILQGDDLINLTAMFYSTLYYFDKKEVNPV